MSHGIPTLYQCRSLPAPYLLDGNAIGQPTPIWIQLLDATGTVLLGSRTMLITDTLRMRSNRRTEYDAIDVMPSLAWENGITEAPWMVKHNNTYSLFYSASGYASPDYCISVAQATDILVGVLHAHDTHGNHS